MAVQTLEATSLRERAIAASMAQAEEYARQTAEQKAREKEQREKDLRFEIERKFGIAGDSLPIRWECWHPEQQEPDPVAHVDGLRFILTRYRRDLEMIFACPDCGEPVLSDNITDLESLGRLLEEPRVPLYHRDDCSARPRTVRPAPVPEPTTEERLLAVLRDFIRENQGGE